MCTVSVNHAQFGGRCSKCTVSRDTGRITSPSPSSRPVAPTSLPHAGDLGLRLAYEATDCRDKYGWQRGAVVSGVRRMNEVNARRARLVPGWVTVFGRVYTISVCNKPTRSTQPCIPSGLLNRVPASAGVRAGMSPLPGGR